MRNINLQIMHVFGLTISKREINHQHSMHTYICKQDNCIKSNRSNMFRGGGVACIAEDNSLAAEGYSRTQQICRNLSNKREEPIRTK